MENTNQIIDYEKAKQDIEKDGFTVLRNILSKESVEQYRQECEQQFRSAPRREGKVYEPGKTPDYVQPWMIHTGKHQVASYRLYQFYHNPHSANTQNIIATIVAIRDRLEKNWPDVQAYNQKNNLVDYNIVAKYAAKSGFQTRHADAESSLTCPALQCEILLTEPEQDYKGGDLILHLFDGRVVRLNEDVHAHVGDLILFDKRVEHEVTETFPVEHESPGRWMALIGAKTFPRQKRSRLQNIRTKASRFLFLHAPIIYRALKRKPPPSSTY